MTDIFTETDIDDGNSLGVLGPHYFSSRRFAESVLTGASGEHLAPIIRKFADEFYSAVQEAFEASIIGDAESNVQGHIWQTVDEIVRGIFAGTPWIMKRWALGERYDCAQAREAIAKHIPRELQDARIADLESEIATLKEDLEWARHR